MTPTDIANLVAKLIPSAPGRSERYFYAENSTECVVPKGECLFNDRFALDVHKPPQPWEKPTASRAAAQVTKPRAARVTKTLPRAGKTRARNALAGIGDDALLALAANRATSSKDV